MFILFIDWAFVEQHAGPKMGMKIFSALGTKTSDTKCDGLFKCLLGKWIKVSSLQASLDFVDESPMLSPLGIISGLSPTE